MWVLIAIAVAASMAVVDYAHARYQHAMREAHAGVRGARWAAVGWSVLQWSASGIGFAVAVGISLWYLPAEAVGLAVGTYFGGGSRDMLSRAEITTRITSGECACFRKSTGKCPSSPGVPSA